MESEQKRNLVLGGLAVVVLAGAGYFFFSGKKPAAQLETYNYRGACLACKQSVDGTMRYDEQFPLKCAKCSKAAVFPWYYCYACKHRFIPPPAQDGGKLHLPIGPACAKCKSTNVGQFDPELGTQQPVGDLPPPDMP